MLGTGEVEQRLEVVRAETVLGVQPCLNSSHQRAVRVQKPPEDGLR